MGSTAFFDLSLGRLAPHLQCVAKTSAGRSVREEVSDFLATKLYNPGKRLMRILHLKALDRVHAP